MLIDWFTVVAQVLNFLILVWLPKRFLYKPVLNAIDVRERRIAKDLADADAKQKQGQADRDEFASKSKAFEEQRGALLTKATSDAAAERDRLLQEAREAADGISKSRHDALLVEAARLNQAVIRRMQQEVFAIARKTLIDLADASLEDRVAKVFISRLSTIEPAMKITLAAALAANADPAVIRSAFDLSLPQQSAIQDALNKTFTATIELRFETSVDLISGIEMTVSGQKLGWTIAGYLGSLKSGIDDVLGEKAATLQAAILPPKAAVATTAIPIRTASTP